MKEHKSEGTLTDPTGDERQVFSLKKIHIKGLTAKEASHRLSTYFNHDVEVSTKEMVIDVTDDQVISYSYWCNKIGHYGSVSIRSTKTSVYVVLTFREPITNLLVERQSKPNTE